MIQNTISEKERRIFERELFGMIDLAIRFANHNCRCVLVAPKEAWYFKDRINQDCLNASLLQSDYYPITTRPTSSDSKPHIFLVRPFAKYKSEQGLGCIYFNDISELSSMDVDLLSEGGKISMFFACVDYYSDAEKDHASDFKIKHASIMNKH